MIVITGGNGPFGRRVVNNLLSRMPAGEFVVSVRDPAAAADLRARGVTVRHGDFDHPESLPAAFAGADTVLVNGTNYGTPPDTRGRQHAAAIRAARQAGARHIVVTSFPDPERNALPMAADAAGTESVLAQSAVQWTVLRMVYGMDQALARDVRWAEAAGELVAPAADARTTAATLAELAEATATVLTSDQHTNRTYELTGPDTIGWDDLAALAATRTGKPIRYRPASDDEFRAFAVGLGFPNRPDAISGLLDFYRAFRSGWASTPTNDLAHLLARPPTPSLEAVRAASSAPHLE
jgi:NAD(P)H dehydrogenase (quinone)